MSETYAVVYRTGGWVSAKWHQTFPKPIDEINELYLQVSRQGYKASIWPVSAIERLGLPVGFCRHADSLTGRMEAKTCKCE